jgi:hypothetical protein
MTDRRIRWNLAVLAALAVAGAAQAGTPSLAALNAAVRPGLSSAIPDAATLPHPGEGAFQRITMMKTAVEHRLGPEGLTGALGLLCGRQPNRDISGGAGAFDKDPEGKFVGAQLSRAF